MDAKEFEKGLLDGLNKLNQYDIKKIRDEYNSEGDYGITEDGKTYETSFTHGIEFNFNNDPSK